MSARREYRVRWTKTASDDLETILDYIAANDGPPAAEKILERIASAAERLRTSCRRGRVVPELKDLGITLYRELIVPPWRIVYRIEGRDVLVLAALDGRRDMESLLLDRLLR